jgi:hypothetical protein
MKSSADAGVSGKIPRLAKRLPGKDAGRRGQSGGMDRHVGSKAGQARRRRSD